MRISIITPSFQQAPYLRECLASVAGQDHPDVEHIVVDGGSDDGSRQLLQDHAAQLAWWCSEPDAGQSAAINKGMARATGRVVGWLNSDDLLLPGALASVAACFAADPAVKVVTAARIMRHADGREELLPADAAADPEAWAVAPRVNQSSTFFRADVWEALGGVEERLRCVMDLELWWRMLFQRGPDGIRVLERPLSVFRLHAASKTANEEVCFQGETAGLLHGLCTAAGHHDLAHVLGLGYRWPRRLRPLPVPQDPALVRSMALHFLLKWNRHVFDRQEFHRMKALQALLDQGAPLPNAALRAVWSEVRQRIAVPNWAAYRLKRKWEHLTGADKAPDR